MKKDLRKSKEWQVRADVTPNSGPLPPRESWVEIGPGPARHFGK